MIFYGWRRTKPAQKMLNNNMKRNTQKGLEIKAIGLAKIKQISPPTTTLSLINKEASQMHKLVLKKWLKLMERWVWKQLSIFYTKRDIVHVQDRHSWDTMWVSKTWIQLVLYAFASNTFVHCVDGAAISIMRCFKGITITTVDLDSQSSQLHMDSIHHMGWWKYFWGQIWLQYWFDGVVWLRSD